MNLFEGNQQILNLYSEVDRPKIFFKMVLVIYVMIVVIICMGIIIDANARLKR